MQINRQNGLNYSRSTAFTSVMPVRVRIDNLDCANTDDIKKVIVKFNKILRGPAKGNEKNVNIVQRFAQVVKDYCFQSGYMGFNKKAVVTRNYVDGKSAFIFTGFHANKIQELGEKVGPAKSSAYERLGTTKSFETQSLTRNYFDKIREFIANPSTRIYGRFSNDTPAQEVGLVISAKSNGKYGKPSFKLDIEGIGFEPIKKT